MMAVGRDHDRARLTAEVERLRAENRTLVRLNRLQGRFVAMASHEFKTPLTSIIAYTDVLQERAAAAGDDGTTKFLGVIRDESARLLRMINRILDFSRLEYGSRLLRREPLGLAELAAGTLRAFGAGFEAREQRAELRAAPDLPPVAADADLVRQVLVNLVGNAAKYAPRGGSVRVSVAEEPATVAVEVADDGPGVAQEDLARIFQEFYRVAGAAEDAEGTGLGLSIVRHVVHLHGGHVTVRRRRSGGTAFTVHLPKLVEVDPAAADPGDPRGAAVLRNALRLLADFTGAHAALLLLRDDGQARAAARMALPRGWNPPRRGPEPVGAEVPAAWRPDPAAPAGAWLVVPLAGDGRHQGWILLGRRDGGGAWTPREREQAAVLGRLASRALDAARGAPGPALEALRTLLRIRWRGVPTATAAALDLASTLGRGLGMAPDEVERLQDAVALHDAGMDRIEEEVLLGTDELGPEEREEIDRHVAVGLDLLAPLLTDAETARIIRHHHERWDGSGHPDGLRGAEIPPAARTLAVIDAWFSLTRGGPHRAALPPAQALDELAGAAGSQFDPDAVAALRRLLATRDPAPGPAPASTA